VLVHYRRGEVLQLRSSLALDVAVQLLQLRRSPALDVAVGSFGELVTNFFAPLFEATLQP
jgi:hypothetical protein